MAPGRRLPHDVKNLLVARRRLMQVHDAAVHLCLPRRAARPISSEEAVRLGSVLRGNEVAAKVVMSRCRRSDDSESPCDGRVTARQKRCRHRSDVIVQRRAGETAGPPMDPMWIPTPPLLQCHRHRGTGLCNLYQPTDGQSQQQRYVERGKLWECLWRNVSTLHQPQPTPKSRQSTTSPLLRT